MTNAYTGPYPVDFTSNTSEILISGKTFAGSVTNAGEVGFGGIIVTSSTLTSGGIVEVGSDAGGIKVDDHSTIEGAGAAIYVSGGVFQATIGISNAGKLSAFQSGIAVLAVSSFDGGITNAGHITVTTTQGKYGIGALSEIDLHRRHHQYRHDIGIPGHC